MPIVLVIIFSVIALVLVLLYFLAPPVFQAVVKYSKRVLKGLVFAHIQFFKYMQEKAMTSEQGKGGMESLKRRLAECEESIKKLRQQLSMKDQEWREALGEIDFLSSERDKIKTDYLELCEEYQSLLSTHNELKGSL